MSGARAAAAFLDKDGTLIDDVPFNVDGARIAWLPGVPAGLAALRDAGLRLVVVSNQPGVARGYFARDALDDVAAQMQRMAGEHGVRFDGFYWCVHDAAPAMPACRCRKPAPGLLHQAASELSIDLARSWMIGDILNDVEAGHRAGCRSILVDRGGETEWQQGPLRDPDFTVPRFDNAAAIVVAHSRGRVAARPALALDC